MPDPRSVNIVGTPERLVVPPATAPDPAAQPFLGLTYDPRVHQANERTLLAWLRTGISLMVFGFVVARFGAWLRMGTDAAVAPSTSWFPVIGAVIVGLGALTNLLAGRDYLHRRRAIMLQEAIVPSATNAVGLAAALTIIGGFLSVYLVTRS